MELCRQLGWAETRAELFHFRSKDGTEVDAVLEAPDGRVVGVEVKAGATVRLEDFRGLRLLADRLGESFRLDWSCTPVPRRSHSVIACAVFR